MLRSAMGYLAVMCFICLAASAQPVPASRPTTQPGDNSPRAEVVQLQIQRPLSQQLSRLPMAQQRRPNMVITNDRGGNTGSIEMMIALTLPDRNIISVAEDALQVKLFLDDKYNDLGRAKREPRQYYSPSQTPPNITEDGHTFLLPIAGERAPASDAARVYLRGSVAVRCSSGLQTSERQALTLRVGKTIDVGPVPLTIRSMQFDSQGTQVQFGSSQSNERIKTLKFFSRDGKEIQASFTGRSDVSPQQGQRQASISYRISGEIDEAQVAVTFIEKIEIVTIPVEVQADVGVVQLGEPKAIGAPKAPTNEAGPEGNAAPPARPAPAVRAAASARPTATADRAPLPWPPPKDATGFPVDRPRISWPATRPLVILPSTRPAAPATGSALGSIPGATVRVCAVGSCALPPDPGRMAWNYRSEFMFQPRGGAQLRMLVSVPQQTILQIDPSRINVRRFADDTGAELSPAIVATGREQSYRMASAAAAPISRDGRQCFFDVNLRDAPTSGATRVMLEGDVAARVGSGEHKLEQKNVELTVGTMINLGSLTLKIESMRSDIEQEEFDPSAWVRPRVYVTFRCNQPADTIRSIRMLDSDDKQIPCAIISATTYQAADGREQTAQTVQCMLGADAPRVTFQVTCFDRVETVSIPFSVITGLGV